MLLLLQFDNSIWSKSLIQHPAIMLWMLCTLQYWLLWNQCFSFWDLYLGLLRQSIVLVWAQISVQCHTYQIYKTRNSWCSVDANCQDWVTKIWCTVMAQTAATTGYINWCHNATLTLPKMRDQTLLKLSWWPFSGCNRERAALVFAPRGS